MFADKGGRGRYFKLAVALTSLNMMCSTSVAAARPSHEAELAHCIARASAGRPWLEQTLWGLRDQEGGWPGAEVRNPNRSHDLGPLQVNSWWVSKLAAATRRPEEHVRWWLIHDVCFNVSSARWIFLSGLVATRDYWKAVGAYHSPTPWRQLQYRAGVARHLRRRFGPNVFGPNVFGPAGRASDHIDRTWR